jgi:uncharacterized protein
MLSFPTQTISAGAVQVNGTLDPDDKVWVEGDDRPTGAGIRVTGRLSVAGPGRYYFSGSLAGTLTQECRRCLGEAATEIAAEAHVLFADSAHVDGDDPDVLPLSQGKSGAEVDLRSAVRQEWLLEVPRFPECRPGCKGLCPTCGANLNQGACSCARNRKE